MEIKNHIGVYGVCYKRGYLLCIQKTSGPYKNRLDFLEVVSNLVKD